MVRKISFIILALSLLFMFGCKSPTGPSTEEEEEVPLETIAKPEGFIYITDFALGDYSWDSDYDDLPDDVNVKVITFADETITIVHEAETFVFTPDELIAYSCSGAGVFSFLFEQDGYYHSISIESYMQGGDPDTRTFDFIFSSFEITDSSKIVRYNYDEILALVKNNETTAENENALNHASFVDYGKYEGSYTQPDGTKDSFTISFEEKKITLSTTSDDYGYEITKEKINFSSDRVEIVNEAYTYTDPPGVFNETPIYRIEDWVGDYFNPGTGHIFSIEPSDDGSLKFTYQTSDNTIITTIIDDATIIRYE